MPKAKCSGVCFCANKYCFILKFRCDERLFLFAKTNRETHGLKGEGMRGGFIIRGVLSTRGIRHLSAQLCTSVS